MLIGNLSCFPRSTWSCQSPTVARSPPVELGWSWWVFCLGLTKEIHWPRTAWVLLCWIAVQMESAKDFKTWLWRQQYRPSPSAFGQQLKMCSRVPLLAQLALGSINQAPSVQVGQAWEDVVNWLDEKLDAWWFSFPELSLDDLTGFCVLPPSPCHLFGHADHFAASIFLRLRLNLVLYQLPLLLSTGQVITQPWKATKTCLSHCHGAHKHNDYIYIRSNITSLMKGWISKILKLLKLN